MSFDAESIGDTVTRHGPVARVVVAQAAGSAPREPGAAMLVWRGGQSGTIGGGALELAAAATARRHLESGGQAVERHPLGPSFGQCCGGAVTLVTEIWDRERLSALPEGPVVRRVEGERPMPVAIHHALRLARGSGVAPDIILDTGWLVEPRHTRARDLWIFGAGHVGRALVGVLHPLPNLSITWIDTGPERFPDDLPAGVSPLVAGQPASVVAHAPGDAEHLVLTYSHAFDLEICHALLGHSFASVGLIGSKTKWVRFQKRLAALGHAPQQIARINCPIGDPSLGKHPQAIALGVAARFLRPVTNTLPEVQRA